MMMSYIGIHPDAYPVVRMKPDDPDWSKFYREVYNDKEYYDWVWWNNEMRDPMELWDSLLVSNLQAIAARSIPWEKRDQLPDMFYQALKDEFKLFESLIYARFPLYSAEGSGNNVAYNILNGYDSFDGDYYTYDMSHGERLGTDMVYLRNKHLELSKRSITALDTHLIASEDWDYDH